MESYAIDTIVIGRATDKWAGGKYHYRVVLRLTAEC